MTIDKIREKLADKIPAQEGWVNQLDESNPGHYGVEDWDVVLSRNDIWVDIPKKTFSFKNARFDFELLLGSSNSEDGTKMSFSKVAKGQGTFEFSESDDIEVEELDLDFDLDLFADE